MKTQRICFFLLILIYKLRSNIAILNLKILKIFLNSLLYELKINEKILLYYFLSFIVSLIKIK